MSDYRVAIKMDEIGLYHYVDRDGRMICTGFAPESLEIVENEDTFGMELCDGCRKREQ